MRALLCAIALGGCGGSAASGVSWDARAPDRNAATLVRLFNDVCVANLGRSSRMHAAVAASGAGFRTDFAGNAQWGPVWTSPVATITAYDHGHNHDGDECAIELEEAVAPGVDAVAAALRAHGLVVGPGEPGEFGATVFSRGDTRIFLRRDVAQQATGVTQADAGLTLLIRRLAG